VLEGVSLSGKRALVRQVAEIEPEATKRAGDKTLRAQP
jgi:hypothetical protein